MFYQTILGDQIIPVYIFIKQSTSITIYFKSKVHYKTCKFGVQVWTCGYI